MGVFHSFRRAILNRDSIVRSLADVILACVAKGYDSSRMLQDIRRCTSHYPELFGLTPHALYTLIRSDVLRRG